jgi:hypothetical protein
METTTSKARTVCRRPFFIFIAIACSLFALCPLAQAITPAPDGGYPGGNTAEGQNALLSLTTGGYNTAVGWFSLRSNMTGAFNTAVGAGTLFGTTVDQNTAVGAGALFSDTTGAQNTGNGAFALFTNTSGELNTAVGADALSGNTIASENTAVGWAALAINDSTGNGVANYNSAFGAAALALNTDGSENSAFGWSALRSNVSGNDNTAIGVRALGENVTGTANTAVGASALFFNTADDNTAVGYGALLESANGSGNTAVGSGALSGIAGDDNIALGAGAGQDTDGSSNILIGNPGVSGESHAIRIGSLFAQTDAYISGVYTAQATSRQVYADSDGHLGTLSSSRRYKESIKAMDRDSEALFAVKPATFHYKKDPAGTRSFGLIAEEVAQVSPDLITWDEYGRPQTVRYEAVNAMLLNEFLKEHKKVEEQHARLVDLDSRVAKQDAIIAQQHKGIETLIAQLKEQAEQVQKISARMEVKKPAPQVVVINPKHVTADQADGATGQ